MLFTSGGVYGTPFQRVRFRDAVMEELPEGLEPQINQLSWRQLITLFYLVCSLGLKKQENKPEGWICGECGKFDEDGMKIVNHLKRTHHYPDEDANLTSMAVWK